MNPLPWVHKLIHVLNNVLLRVLLLFNLVLSLFNPRVVDLLLSNFRSGERLSLGTILARRTGNGFVQGRESRFEGLDCLVPRAKFEAGCAKPAPAFGVCWIKFDRLESIPLIMT